MHEYDTTLKEVLLESAGLTLRRLTGLDIHSWRNVELPAVSAPRLDLLGETDTLDLVHMELQSTNDPAIPIRMLRYGVGTYDQYGRFPIQIVLYVGSAPLRMSNHLDLPALTYRFQLIDIRELDGVELCESPFLGDNIISILANWSDRRESVRRVLQRIARQEPARRAKALKQLMVLAGLRKLGGSIEREITQMPILDDIMDHEVLGRERKAGLQQGRIEGRFEGELSVILRQLRKRFGQLPPGVEERLSIRSPQQLDDIADRLLDCHNLEDLLR